jgi:hypothetical protein
VFNHISKFITSSILKVPVAGIVLAVSVLGISYAGEQHQEILPSTAIATNYVIPTHQSQINSQPALLSRLREVKETRIQQQSNLDSNNFTKVEKSPIANSHQESAERLTENLTTLSTNTRELDRKGIVQFPQQDGIYLYGQSATPNQLGQGYILFQKQQGKVIGALYMPQSEFSCFQGALAQSGELAMTVRSSPGELGTMEISTASTIPKFSDDESTSYAHSVTLQDYHHLKSLSANDKEMLQKCKQEINGVR